MLLYANIVFNMLYGIMIPMILIVYIKYFLESLLYNRHSLY